MFAGIISFNFPIAAIAAAPDAGQILRDTKPASPLPPTRQPEENIVPEAVKPVVQPSPSDDVRVTISHFTFTGNVTFSQEVLHAAIADAENKPLNFGELMAVVDKVEAVYKKAGMERGRAVGGGGG